MRDPVGMASKVNFIDAGMFSSSKLFSRSFASNELIGFTAMNFQEPLHFSPFGLQVVGNVGLMLAAAQNRSQPKYAVGNVGCGEDLNPL